MSYDDRPEPAKRLEEARLARGFRFAKDACTFFNWNYNSYAQHESGQRGIGRVAAKYAKAFRVSEAWLLTGEGRGPSGETPPLFEEENEFNDLLSKATEEDKRALLQLLRSLVSSKNS